MPKGYWIANNVVHDVEKYKDYQAANGVVFQKYGVRFLVRGGEQEVREGQAHDRSVVIEFPSYTDAVECYNSPEYQKAYQLRAGISESNLIIVEGYDG